MENKIYKICEDVLTITDDEIKELREIAEGQKRYNNPLRMATSGWQQELGEHNDKVLDAIIALKKELEAGAEIERPNLGLGGTKQNESVSVQPVCAVTAG